jgi:hypothetical protein
MIHWHRTDVMPPDSYRDRFACPFPRPYRTSPARLNSFGRVLVLLHEQKKEDGFGCRAKLYSTFCLDTTSTFFLLFAQKKEAKKNAGKTNCSARFANLRTNTRTTGSISHDS